MKSKPVFKFATVRDVSLDKISFIPTRGEPAATGYDVRSAVSITLKPGQYFKIPLGIRCFPPKGWWFQLHPRSSSFVKKHMHCLIGVIDEHYPNELVFAGQYLPEDNEKELVINFGDPVGQIIPVERVDAEMVEISNIDFDDLLSKRESKRTGGFGSTTDSK